jgi:hypothetical protein
MRDIANLNKEVDNNESPEVKLIDEMVVSRQIESHYKVEINGKEVCVSVYENFDEFDCEKDVEIFKGKELLTDDEEEIVLDFIEDLKGE